MNRLIFTTIFYISLCGTSFAQPSVFEHPSGYWMYSYCYYADFRPSGLSDSGANIEVYNMGEVDRNGKAYQLAYRVKGYLYHIPSMVDTLLYRREGSRVYADLEDMCRVFYGGDGDALRSDYPCLDGEVVLYDFTLGVGDTFGRTHVREVSTVTVGGEPRRLITLATGQRLLEGIGSLGGGFFEYMMAPLWLPGFSGICTNYLSFYKKDGQLVFQQSCEEYYDFLLAEEDVQDYLLMEIDGTNIRSGSEKTLYDLQGRRVAGTPMRGIYIRGGRKYVVR